MKRFKYNDKVRVIGGFYAGQQGYAKKETLFWIFKQYLVSGTVVEFISAFNLELVKE